MGIMLVIGSEFQRKKNVPAAQISISFRRLKMTCIFDEQYVSYKWAIYLVMPIEWSIFENSYINVFIKAHFCDRTYCDAESETYQQIEKKIIRKMYKCLTVFVLACIALGYCEVEKSTLLFQFKLLLHLNK